MTRNRSSRRGNGGNSRVLEASMVCTLTRRSLVAEKWSHDLQLVQKRPRASYVGWRNVPVTAQHTVIVERAVLTVFPVVVRALVPSDRSATGGHWDRGDC